MMKDFPDGLFGKLNTREMRLIMFATGSTAALMVLIPLDSSRYIFGLLGFLVSAMIVFNQYHRVKRGVDPNNPDI